MVKKLPDVEKKVEKFFNKKNLKDWTKWNWKMGGRSCFIASGAFGHGLLCSMQCTQCSQFEQHNQEKPKVNVYYAYIW